jgi:precorrin-6B methylase 2
MLILNIILIFFLYAIIFAVLFSFGYAWLSLAPWVPTKKDDLKRIDKLAKLKKGQTFLDMGCGTGTVCAYIAKRNPKSRVIGIELAWPIYLFTKIKTAFSGPKNLEIVFGNALKYDIKKIDVIYVFGLTGTVNKKIKRKILKEMNQKAKLISYVFKIKDWENGKTIKHKENDKTYSLYVYQKR